MSILALPLVAGVMNLLEVAAIVLAEKVAPPGRLGPWCAVALPLAWGLARALAA